MYPREQWTTFWIVACVLFGLLLARNGVNKASIIVCGVAAVLLCIPFYFATRDRSKPPSRTERSLAFAWMIFRRTLGIFFGGAMVAGAGVAFVKGPFGPGESVFLLLIGLCVLWATWFGQGYKKHTFTDDLDLHRENKRRYRWWC
ncbi:hypothetical protein [Inhella proteolytica]|uniref:Uncharacterized protein n=1 Tax=Inhella proteolytica TaxID=2795029 RepID=A0A931NH35_9BURK|nr:hypothetical protein [Inhella proteolytica]MBH9576095.1 hypothetical protein [Inhella proteolytica]